MKITRSEIELIETLQEQRNFLQSSCKNYDEGNFVEAKRIAAVIHLLVHDPIMSNPKRNPTQSLFKQLKIKNDYTFPSIATKNVSNKSKLAQMPLIGFRLDNTDKENKNVHFVARCNQFEFFKDNLNFSELKFDEWWEEKVLIDTNNHSLSRKNLISMLRDKEGGVHFDAEISDANYLNIAKKNSLGLEALIQEDGTLSLDFYGSGALGLSNNCVKKGHKVNIMSSPIYATVRHIAWEIDTFIERFFNDYRLNVAS